MAVTKQEEIYKHRQVCVFLAFFFHTESLDSNTQVLQGGKISNKHHKEKIKIKKRVPWAFPHFYTPHWIRQFLHPVKWDQTTGSPFELHLHLEARLACGSQVKVHKGGMFQVSIFPRNRGQFWKKVVCCHTGSIVTQESTKRWCRHYEDTCYLLKSYFAITELVLYSFRKNKTSIHDCKGECLPANHFFGRRDEAKMENRFTQWRRAQSSASGRSYVKSPGLIHLMFNCPTKKLNLDPSTHAHESSPTESVLSGTDGQTGAEDGHVFGQKSTCGSLHTQHWGTRRRGSDKPSSALEGSVWMTWRKGAG